MTLFYQKRCTGKTCTLVLMSAKNNIPIGTAYPSTKRHIEECAQEMGLNIPSPIVLKDISELKSYGEIYIDDLDIVLNKLSKIKAATWSEGDTASDERFLRERIRSEVDSALCEYTNTLTNILHTELMKKRSKT